MSGLKGKASRLLAATVLGALCGLALEFLQPRLGAAQALLFFPPALGYHAGLTPPENATKEELVEPVAWASELLRSPEAVDAVCKRIDRSTMPSKTEAMRSAVLLLEKKRIEIYPLPDSFLRLRVLAEDPEIAQNLCEGLLAYLAFRSKIPLEDKDAGTLKKLESDLRIQEKSIAEGLWRNLALDQSSEHKFDTQALDLELLEYQANRQKVKKALGQHFFREAQIAASAPSHFVIEPAAASKVPINWRRGLIWGGLSGMAVFLLARGLRPFFLSSPAGPVTFQEHRYTRRTRD